MDTKSPRLSIFLGLFMTTLATLLLQLTLIRLFDIVLRPNYAYMIVSSAIFAFGLAGIAVSIFPPRRPQAWLRTATFLAALSVAAIILVINYVPFDFSNFNTAPVAQLFFVILLYASLVLPFFLAGLVVSIVFTEYYAQAQKLYFFDLAGAAIGCLLLAPLMPTFGPGGLFLFISGLLLVAMLLFGRGSKASTAAFGAVAVLLILAPVFLDDYIHMREHTSKRGVLEATEAGIVEYTRWDPVSKIDVIPSERAGNKHVAYDGGNQSTYFFPFDGDFDALLDRVESGGVDKEFWGPKVLVSHYLKRRNGSQVLIIGSAGGQETKAALLYGAAHVDGVELVETVVELGKTRYADYIGDIFNHPNANIVHGEGRSFLRASDKQYDIIQIFSNHTSSSIANGYGALSPVYLQTADAYEEYFRHLGTEGILHVNHHYYTRMLTTAAEGWRRLGRSDFERHALVFEAPEGQTGGSLPTMLIKMSPWTAEEFEQIRVFMDRYEVVFDPLSPAGNLITTSMLEDPDDPAYAAAEFHIRPATDDRPYFAFMRKRISAYDAAETDYMDWGTAHILNKQLKGPLPMDVIHLAVVGLIALAFSSVFILVPLRFSEAGRASWAGKGPAMVYFSCLGAGFIIFELTLIQIFMRLIGYPVYTYSTVVFGLLAAAGTGSLLAGRMKLTQGKRWTWVFFGIFGVYALFALVFPQLFDAVQSISTTGRILVSMLILAPLGFFVGIPFPMAIARLGEHKQAAIPWAWGMNGLFTVIGGLASVMLSLYLGFRLTLLAGIVIYAIALMAFSSMSRAVRSAA